MINDGRRLAVSMAISRRFGVIQTQAHLPSRVVRLNHPINHHPGIAAPATRQRNR